MGKRRLISEFERDLSALVLKWKEAGVSPDAFVTCAACGGIFKDAALEGDKICICDDRRES